jgi:flagellar assembly protein FliH
MSSSCDPVVEAQRKTEVRSFPYAEVALAGSTGGHSSLAPDSVEDSTRRETALREQARQEGELRARAECQTQLSRVRENLVKALADFARERATYYQQVEVEVVRLALSMAGKILHREAQVDPLLLAGLVHVALQQIESGTKVILRVHPQQVSEFRSYFAQHLEPQNVPEVAEDPAVERECCVLQTSLGTTQLGLEVQLKEIEQGLFDLLGRRPQGAP